MSAQVQPKPADNGSRDVAIRPNKQMIQTLEKMRSQIAAALPKHVKPEYFIRVVVTACNKTPKLYEAFVSDPQSFLGAVMECSQLGLVPDGILGMAYLVPFWNGRAKKLQTQVMIGYHGLMDLAYRSDKVEFIQAHTVREGDLFDYDLAQMTIQHKPGALGARGTPTHYYAVARVKGIPFPVFIVMSRADAERHRDTFAKDPEKGPWHDHFDAMSEKTCVRGLCKWLPRSTEIQRAVALDTLAEAAIPQDLGAAAIDTTAVEERASQLEQLTERLADESAADGPEAASADQPAAPAPAPEPERRAAAAAAAPQPVDASAPQRPRRAPATPDFGF